MKWTTISISDETRTKLGDLGKYGESMDEIINKLIKSSNTVPGGFTDDN